MRYKSAASGHAHEGSVTPLQPLRRPSPKRPGKAVSPQGLPPPNPNNPRSNRSSSSLPISASRALGGLAVVLALAVGLLLSSSGPLQAQDSSTIEYLENGEGDVATYTATDPENAGAVKWTLDGDDALDFEIDESSGVLTFAEVPDYEMAADRDTNNEYLVTVVATDTDGMVTNELVTVTVTNKDEGGTVTLSAVAPYPGVDFTATHTDPDGEVAGADWQWSRSRSKGGTYTDIEGAEEATYSPTSGDVGFYLRATVTYNDGQGEGKSAMATSAHTVQAINEPNATPEFTDEDTDISGVQAARMVEENTPAGEDVGLPVEASDSDNDILTYTIDDTAAATFDIEAASGQIKTKADLDFDTVQTYTATVTATDPAGASTEVTVTITVTDVNEPPDITGDVVDYVENGTGVVATFTATDPEGEGTVTLDLSGADASLFSLSQGGVLTFNNPPNYEKPGDADGDNTYEVTVGARDGDGIRGTRDIEVKVTNDDEDGTVTLSAVQPRVGVAVTARLTDIDGPVSGVTWQWSAGGSDIADATSDTYTPTATDTGTLTATANYTDPQGSEKTASGDSDRVVAVDTRNKAPEFVDQDTDTEGNQNTEAERTVEENTVAPNSVNGGAISATDSNSGDVVSYTLGGPDASSFDIDLTNGQITVGVGTDVDYETKDTYMVTVIATDSFGATASIAVTIKVTDVNEGPEVTGLDQVDYAEGGEGGEGDVATYTATDPENAGAVKWTLDGDDALDFEIDESSGVLTFAEVPDYEMAADRDTNNEYLVTVVATDTDGMVTNELVTVTVTNKDEGGTVTLSVVAPYPGVDFTATHTDPDGEVAGADWQWSRSRSKGGTYTDIEGAEEATYSPTSGDVGFYLRATVTYNDGQGEGKSAMATSAHTVQAINEPNATPEFADEDTDISGVQAARMVEENTPAGEDVGLPVEASDSDNGILTYTIDDTAAATFDIEAASGQIKTKADLDFDTVQTYTATVTATDPAGASTEVTVTITVTDVNEPPDITGDVVDYVENGTGVVATFTATDPEGEGTVTLDLSGADASLFSLSQGGVLTFNNPPNYEKPGDADGDNTYEVTVGARDGDGIRGTRDIEVKVTNDDEDGTVTLSAVQPRVGVAVTARLTDIDGPVSGVTWQWSAGGSDIADATSDTYTPTATDTGTLTATANYTDPQGSEKTASGDSDRVVAVDTRNKAPEFVDQDTDTEGNQNTEAERTVEENTVAPNSVNGGAISATDSNSGDVVSYTLGGPDASSFDIDLTNGQITVGVGTDVDYETKDTYMVTVIATDSFGATASIAVTIKVTDVNEGPEIRRVASDNQPPSFPAETDTRSVVEGTSAGADIGAPVTAEDPDVGDALTYTLGGTDAASFDIVRTTGQLQTKAALDYSTKTSYVVTVTATDAAGLSDAITVTINVTAVDENRPPEFPSAATTREVAENTVAGVDIGAPVAANDADDAALTYTLSGTDAASFDIDGTTGQLRTKASLDFETKSSYTVMVTATDPHNLTDTATVTITVTNVNEPDRTRDEIRLEIEEAILAAVLSDGIDDAERSAIEQLILEFALTPSS